jgi:hypothetical protein
MVNPEELVEFDGKVLTLKELPPEHRSFFGLGHFTHDIEYRERHLGIGTYEPDECPRADEPFGVWINYEQNLVCPGCGLDFT